MKVRKMNNSEKDYSIFVKLSYRTNYSLEVGKISDEETEVDPCDPIPDYNEFCDILNFELYKYFVLENDDKKVIGLAQVSENEICEFTIDREHQLSGNGRIFYQLLEDIIKKESGAKSIVLTCYFPGSMIFWKKMGFKNRNIIFTKEL